MATCQKVFPLRSVPYEKGTFVRVNFLACCQTKQSLITFNWSHLFFFLLVQPFESMFEQPEAETEMVEQIPFLSNSNFRLFLDYNGGCVGWPIISKRKR